ncbi:hypothetical protein ElyMa_004290800 [Elysia marginata]|uniref:Uncharacterized protein n=1 Tax=Elysia marginata TaxID=1093978 RepID=A0AAV4GY67_9GAST|nr:hypothetical protein ElyMa_004290800 [Elysia marginata]
MNVQASFIRVYTVNNERLNNTAVESEKRGETCPGAVGDVDGDGSLDYVHVTQMAGTKRADTGHVLDVFASLSITKLSLGAILSQPQITTLSSPSEDDRAWDGYSKHRKGYGSDHNRVSGESWSNAGSHDNVGVSPVDKHDARHHFEKLQLMQASLQPWAQSSGTRGGSWYDVPPS